MQPSGKISPAKQVPNDSGGAAADLPDETAELTFAQLTLGSHRFCREFRKRYLINELLGEGGFGFVVSAYDTLCDDQEVAVKFILKGTNFHSRFDNFKHKLRQGSDRFVY